MSDILENLQNPLPHFAGETIKELTEKMLSDAKMFSVSHYWCDRESVNVHEVVGTQHPDYANKSWLNLLQNGKRMPLNLRLLNDNPQYYFQTDVKAPSMQFIKIDNELFVGADGNHRTCIAKFFLFQNSATNIHGITLDEYTTDVLFKFAYHRITQYINKELLPITTEIIRNRVARRDTAGWKRDNFELQLYIKNLKSSVEDTLDIRSMNHFINEAQMPLRSYRGKYKFFWKK